MTGEITIDPEYLDLKTLNEIIIAVENHRYLILPLKTPGGKYEFVLKPEGLSGEAWGYYDMAIIPKELRALRLPRNLWGDSCLYPGIRFQDDHRVG